MGRQPCCGKVGIRKGHWTAEEDKKLVDFIAANGHCCWRTLPKLAGLQRCGKSCRLRWINYLRPDLKRGLLSEPEEQIVIELHSRLGNRWSKIAAKLPGRTDNEIKNYWNTHIKKKLRKMGIDPVAHEPINGESSPETSHSTLTAEVQLECLQQQKQVHLPDSCNPPENCSNISGLYSDLVSSLLEDEEDLPPVDNFWMQPSNGVEFSNPVRFFEWDDYDWLLDYQDFGIGDLEVQGIDVRELQ